MRKQLNINILHFQQTAIPKEDNVRTKRQNFTIEGIFGATYTE